jgi:indolepyruvate ferredoxin oxidoreductase beta subunit
MLSAEPMNVVIAGVGGQGNVLAAQILGVAMLRQGYQVVVGETYGASQRGGAVMSHVRIGREEPCGPLVPAGDAHLVLGLEPVETLRMLGRYGNPETRVLTNTRPIRPLDVLAGDATYPEIDRLLAAIRNLSRRTWTIGATDIALELGDPVLANVVMLGALVATGVLPLAATDLHQALGQVVPAAALPKNLAALGRGLTAVAGC